MWRIKYNKKILKIKFPNFLNLINYIALLTLIFLANFIIGFNDLRAEVKIDQINNKEASNQAANSENNSLVIKNFSNPQENLVINDNNIPKNQTMNTKLQYGLALDFGLRFILKDLAKNHHNKSIIYEFSYINNLNKFLSKVDYITSIRLGYCHEFNRIQFIVSSNLASVNSNLLKKIISKSNQEISFLYGLSIGYRINSLMTIRSNLLTSFNKKINLNNNEKDKLNSINLSFSINI